MPTTTEGHGSSSVLDGTDRASTAAPTAILMNPLQSELTGVERIVIPLFDHKEMTDEMQAEVAALVELLPYLNQRRYASLLPLARLAIIALAAKPPKLILAKQLRTRLKERTGASAFGWSSAYQVILGLVVFLLFVLPLLLFFGRKMFGVSQWGYGFDPTFIMLVAIAGTLGSCVSICVRIREFEMQDEVEAFVLILNGLSRPLIGMSFALFVFAVLMSGLLPVSFDEKKAPYFFIAIAFVTGFSERLAQNVANGTEKVITASLSTTEKAI